MNNFTLTTTKMVQYLGISKDFLLKNKDKLFIKGIHYFIPNGFNKILWNVNEMEKWVKNDTKNPFEEFLNVL